MAAVIRLDGVGYAYGQGKAANQVLYDVAAEIAAGELVVLTGPSGSGKTTLLTLIGALRRPQEGRIEVLGSELSRLRPRERTALRRRIGFIFQMHNLFDALSAYENVRLAMQLGRWRRREMRRRGIEILSRLGLGSRADEKPAALSVGECQRVAVARALVNRPPLVLADEPTAALDRDSRGSVLDLLRETVAEHGSTVLMVTHDRRIIETADRLIEMDDGRVVGDTRLKSGEAAREFLRGSEVFAGLGSEALAQLARRMRRRRFAKDAVVGRAGEEVEECLVIANGSAEILRHGRNGARLGAGDLLGGHELLYGEPRLATILARGELDAFALEKPDFLEVVEEWPALRAALRKAAAPLR